MSLLLPLTLLPLTLVPTPNLRMRMVAPRLAAPPAMLLGGKPPPEVMVVLKPAYKGAARGGECAASPRCPG